VSLPPFQTCGSGRAGPLPRCPRCALHLELCLCDAVEPLALATRVVVVCHQAELNKSTNTGRLVPLTLTQGEVRVRGRKHERLATADLLAPQRAPLLLYPTAEARDLRQVLADEQRPVTLIVPDGTWRQARKVTTREPDLAGVPRVRLPPGPPSRYRLRSHPDPRFVATFEAVARALGILEGPEVQAHLEAVFERMVRRTLWTRGKLGGIDRAEL
jgi:DTW domain-containing protein YfiP